MITSRRLALVAAALGLGLVSTACGNDPGRTSAGLPTISLSAGGGATAEASAAGDAKMSMVVLGDITYVYDGTLPDLGTASTAYRFPGGMSPDLDRVRDLAAALGIDGDVVEQPADMGGGWMVGPSDYSGPTLSVARDGLLSWWYSNPDPRLSMGCAAPAVDTGAGSDGSGTSSTDEVAETDKPAVIDCPAPEVPTGVPTADEAKASAIEFLASAGVDTDGLDWEVWADDWSASATAFVLIDGARGPQAWSVGYGAEGALTWASGSFATAEEVGEYPIVSTTEGLERLNDDSMQWQWYGSGMAYAARDVAVSSESGAVGVVGATDGVAVQGTTGTGTMVTVGEDGTVSTGSGATGSGTSGTGSVVVDTIVPVPAIDSSTPILITPTPEQPEPITITLNAVRLGLTQVWDADGTVWMLPAYVFSGVETGDVTVIAVDEAYLDIPEVPMPEPMPEPMPVETVAPGGDLPLPTEVSLDEAIALLTGLAEPEALDAAAAAGWTVRTVRLDGEDLAVTMDYSPTRVNVAIEGGIVTEVVSIG